MKPETTVFTVRLPVSMRDDLDSIAASMDRSRSWLVTQAIEDFMHVQKWQMEQIKLALKEANEGDFATDEEMADLWNMFEPKS